MQILQWVNPSHSLKLKIYQATIDIKEAAGNSQWSARALIIDSLADFNTAACPLMPPLPNLSHNIRSWSQRGISLLLWSKKEMATWFLMKTSFLKMVKTFCYFDSGDYGIDRILIFNTESGLDNLAHRGTGHVMEHLNVIQVCTTNYSHYIWIRNSSISLVLIILPRKSKET